MKQFAQLLNTLFFTYSHRDKMTLIQRYFAATPDPERGYALAIMARTLKFPEFRPSLIKELIHEKLDPFLFSLSYDYVGDLSETIALLWPESKHQEPLPLLSEIVWALSNLPKAKIKPYVHYLLDRSNANERWALLKLGRDSLRIGISARFLKNTLAKYGQVDVQEIEHIWHALQAPYTELFAWLEGRADKPSVTGTIFFHPVMLSHPIDEKELNSLATSEFNYEKKYDGIRVQAVVSEQDKALFSRTGDEISHSFPDVLNAIQTEVVLDGELVIIKEGQIASFNDLQQRLNRKTPSKKLVSDLPAGLVLYDILSAERNDLRNLPFYERRKKLEHWFSLHHQPNLILSELLPLGEKESLYELRDLILKENHPAVEGLMIKHKNSPYLAGRPKGHWYKWKRNPLVVDAVLMYAQRGQGKRSSYYSDYTFGLWDKGALVPIGKAYFGFTDAELLELDRWIRNHTMQRFGPVREVEKALVFEVAFDAVNFSSRHKSGVALRFPRINRVRWDKPAQESDHLETLVKLINP